MKRYTVTIETYVFAKDDVKACLKADKILKKVSNKYGGDPAIIEIHETPFASLHSRKIELK